MKTKTIEIRLKGSPVSRGIAIGKPYFLSYIHEHVPKSSVPRKEIEEEIARYVAALSKSKKDVEQLQKRLKKEKVAEGAAILDTHLQMMQDPLLTTLIEEKIRKTRKNAAFVFQETIEDYQAKFQAMPDPFFRDRFMDIQDVSRRVMGYLHESFRASFSEIPADSVVFSEELSASDSAEASVSLVNAFVTSKGGPTSHAAIIAKAKGIPYVTDLPFQNVADQLMCSCVIVDGRTGEVIFSPEEETLKKYEVLQSNLESQHVGLSKNKELASETTDGYPIKLYANIDMVDEVETFHENGGEGVGLFRSEYIFLSNNSFPTEEEQYRIYSRLIKRMKDLPIVIRTFDFGGDKLKLNQHIPFDGNPFLGSSSIRSWLNERGIFRSQLRAILRASKFGDVSIMFPMISSLVEMLEAKQALVETKRELQERGIEVSETIRVGCMIEVPSAVIVADLLAKECDFLSIGTNDLVQYSLAVDRRHQSSSMISAPTDPSVLRMIKHVVVEAAKRQIPVTVCGEIAADPRFTPLLIGLGVQVLSVSSRYIPLIKNAVRSTKMTASNQFAKKILSLTNANQILDLLSAKYQTSSPNDLFYPD